MEEPKRVSGDHVVISCGAEPCIVIDKLFGPLVACQLRITLDLDSAEWVISREKDIGEGKSEWEEVTRISCQESLNLEGE